MSLKKSLKWAAIANASMVRKFKGIEERVKFFESLQCDSVYSYASFVGIWEGTYHMLRQTKNKDEKRSLIKELEILEQREWQLAKEVYKDIFKLENRGDI